MRKMRGFGSGRRRTVEGKLEDGRKWGDGGDLEMEMMAVRRSGGGGGGGGGGLRTAASRWQWR